MGAVLAVVRPEAAAKPACLCRDHAATSISSPESRACWQTAQSIYIHTFKCGLYLVRGVERLRAVDDVRAGLSQGKDCGVPVLTGHHWLQTVPEAHAVVSLDISDPEHPREVSKLGWWARTSSRTGCRSIRQDAAWCSTRAAAAEGNRLFVINFDPGYRPALRSTTASASEDSTRPGHHADGQEVAARLQWDGRAPWHRLLTVTGWKAPSCAVFNGRWRAAVLHSTRITKLVGVTRRGFSPGKVERNFTPAQNPVQTTRTIPFGRLGSHASEGSCGTDPPDANRRSASRAGLHRS